MIDKVKNQIERDTGAPAEVSQVLAETVVALVLADLIGELRANLPSSGGCPECLEVRRRAIDILIEAAPV